MCRPYPDCGRPVPAWSVLGTGTKLHAVTRANPVQLIGPHQDLSSLGAFRGPQDAVVVKLVHDAGGSSVTDLQPALEQGRRALILVNADFPRSPKQFVPVDGAPGGEGRVGLLVRLVHPHLFEEVRLLLRVLFPRPRSEVRSGRSTMPSSGRSRAWRCTLPECGLVHWCPAEGTACRHYQATRQHRFDPESFVNRSWRRRGRRYVTGSSP